jgi:hypothetical protein
VNSIEETLQKPLMIAPTVEKIVEKLNESKDKISIDPKMDFYERFKKNLPLYDIPHTS